MPTNVPKDVPSAFFSYCRADSDFALKLAEDLKASGANVWIDQLDIEPGTPWDGAVEEALIKSPRMLVVLSAVSVVSPNVRDEITYALSHEKRVIPVLITDCDLPIRLSRLQHIDFRTDYPRGLRLLLKSLGMAANVSAAPAIDSAAVNAKSERSDHGPTASAERVPQRMAVGEAKTEQANTEEEVQHLEGSQQRAPQVVLPQVPVTAARSATFPAWGKVVAAALAVSLAVWLLYLALRPSNKQKNETNHPPAGSSAANPSEAPGAIDVNSKSNNSPESTISAKKQVGEIPNGSLPAPASTNAVPPGLSAEYAALYRKAQAGDAAAMNALGVAYSDGKGAPHDEKQAVYWYRKAADAGNAFGMSNLGFMYKYGKGGLPKDEQQAVYWYRRAADAGNYSGMSSLGDMYQYGEGGLPKDNQQAASWYRKAADGGDTHGMLNLGFMYEVGEGVPQDYQQAVYWYRKAADAGNTVGLVNLGQMYWLDRPGFRKDYQQAMSWFRKAADKGNPVGASCLGTMYRFGWGVPQDNQQAIYWYRKAVQLGDASAKNDLKDLGANP